MSSAERSRSHSRYRVLWLSLGVFGVLIIGATAWVGVRGLLAHDHLASAMSEASELQGQLESADLDQAAASAARLGESARAAAELTSDPLWRAAEYVPLVGANLGAVRVVSSELDRLSAGAIAPALELVPDLDGLGFNGGVDLDVVSRASQELGGALSVVHDARLELEAVDADALIGPLREGVESLHGYLAAVEPLVRSADLAARTLPAVLGQDGPRSILIMVQNGAELRTGGGLTGAFAELTADNGSVELVDQASSSDFPWLEEPITALPQSVGSMFDDAVGRYVMNITSPADFSVSADLASEWWEMRTGHRPDTIISVDVQALSSLLAVIGPVEVDDWGELTATNLVQRLLVDPYVELDSAEQDVLFKHSVSTVFAKALEMKIDVTTLLAQLSRPIEQGRVSAWSDDPAVQSVIDASPFAGSMGRQAQAGDEAYAVYLNDFTGAKMDTYLLTAIESQVGACRPDDLRDITVSVTLTNTAPQDAGQTLPLSVTGGGLWGVAPGDIGTLVAVSAPPGTFIGGVTQDGELIRSVGGDVDGFSLTQARVVLPPGAAATLEFHFIAAHPGDVEPKILSTPLINEPTITHGELVCS